MQPPPISTRGKSSTKRTILIVAGGIVALIACIAVLVGSIFALVAGLLRSSEPYQHAMELATSDSRVIHSLGEPIEPGWMPMGNINLNNDRGDAKLSISLSGPHGKGRVEVIATKARGTWTYHQLNFQDDQTGTSFSLIDEQTLNNQIRALIVDGFSNHHWQLNTQIIHDTLETTGFFNVDVSSAPPSTDSPGWDDWRPGFSNYDVVIQTCNDIGGGPSWPEPVKQAFESYVRNGGGVFIHHSANNAFPNWDAYNDIIGLGWRKADQGTSIAIDDNGNLIRIPPGEGKNTGHGPRVDATITRLGDHPIHAGLPRQWRTPDLEIYHHSRGPAQHLQVLSYATEPSTGIHWPIEWTIHYGAGRIYNSTYGHVWHDDESTPARTRCAAVQTLMVRALFWLALREPMPPVPDDFPSEERTSIRHQPR